MESNPTTHTVELSGIRFYQYMSPAQETEILDIIIIGGSYAGLSAAMTLGRSLRRVLVIDSSHPCNNKAPQVHNFITQDGELPGNIIKKTKQQVLKYKTVRITHDKAVFAKKENGKFIVETTLGLKYTGKKILFATGIFDQMLPIPGFAECWGVSVLHCSYCHGYEFYNKPMGILANGDTAFEMAKHLSNWSRKLMVFTNGIATFLPAQLLKFSQKNISITDKKIERLEHKDGVLKNIIFKDQAQQKLHVIFTKVPFRQSTGIPHEQLGCALTEEGLIKVDMFHKTSVPGVYAAGDNSITGRAISISIAAGTLAAIGLNKELIEEEF